MQPGDDLRKDWIPFLDEVIIRSTQRLPVICSEDLDSAPRHHYHIIDPHLGPDQRNMVSNPERIPEYLSQAYRVLKPKLRNGNLESQFTPWAMGCLAPQPSPLRTIRFAIELCHSMDPFFRVCSLNIFDLECKYFYKRKQLVMVILGTK